MTGRKQYRLPPRMLILLIGLYSHSYALKCYVGSKGHSQNGKAVHSFLPNECEEEMTHCFESYSDDMTQITASCQSLNTEQRLLDVCKQGCQNHVDLNITICCCDSDLCNLPPEEKKNITDGDTSTGGNDKHEIIEIEVVEMNSTANSTEVDESSVSLADLLDHPKFLRLPHAL
ncbi:hypothetical protein ANCDUO_02597 [Ancylostoma duodenale]|uniref:Uncharacterized protein n=1 Tax=Ancylostoma duodenale TaxID=51022 RepID=A0A0C2DBA9_9BILA|nr:hypothetical protein ANCDUO_02597 [Ancylostoma duodenale]